MKIYYDFDFIDDTASDIQLGDYVFMRKDIQIAMYALEESIRKLKQSIYSKCFKEVYLVLTDCPAEAIEYVDVDEMNQKLQIHLNILSLIWDYHCNSLYRRIIFKDKWQEIDLYTYVSFFFFHECGHIVHAQISSPNSKKIVDKFEAVVTKYQHFHQSLDLKFNLHSRHLLQGSEYEKLERAYRKIPSEKVADHFAFMMLGF